VVIDEIVEDRIRLVVASWPRLDHDGRLYFDDLGRYAGPFVPANLQTVVDRHRARRGQVRRPLRVGDAFLVRGSARQPSRWTYALDVTHGARVAARLAVARAVTLPASVKPRRKGRGRAAAEAVTPTPAPRERERVAGSVALPAL
jgi:hypothetical protein